MKNLRILPAFILGTILFLFSCKKNDDDTTAACRVSKVYLYDSTNVYDSALYTYTGDLVTKSQMSGEYYTLEYNAAGLVTKRSHYTALAAMVADDYWLATYNAANNISKIEMYERSGSTYTLNGYVDFTYTAGKLSKTTAYDMVAGIPSKTEEDNYTYSGNNITMVSTTYYFGGQTFSFSATYSYDANANYLKKQQAQMYLVDPNFIYLDPSLLPFALSENNVTAVNIQGTVYSVSYLLDQNQNVSQFSIDNQTVASYSYQCP
ncbi:MAG TPA: hypothetical protein VFZ78_08895 [Flavisolibacter sp.]